jgi:hypothetical protein
MFSIGEYVFHQETGNIGKVIGYRHQVPNDISTTTLKVLVDCALNSGERGVVEEDIYSAWSKWL